MPETYSRIPKPFSETTFQSIPSILLNDLRRQDASGNPVLEQTDIVVYALLKAHAHQKDWCNPGYECLAIEAACSVSTIRRSLKRLEAAKHILRKSRNETGNIFLLTDVLKGKVISRTMKVSPPRIPMKARIVTYPQIEPLTPPTAIPDPNDEIDWDSDEAPF